MHTIQMEKLVEQSKQYLREIVQSTQIDISADVSKKMSSEDFERYLKKHQEEMSALSLQIMTDIY